MTRENFDEQLSRLRFRFGDRNFDPEFIKLLAKEVQSMPDHDLTRMVSDFIGSRPATRPPLLVDFREARIQIEKYKFTREVQGAADAVFDWAKQKGLKAFLDENYPGCKSLWEAVQVQVEVNQAQREREGE
jgi:hypothetical protein